MASQGAPSRDSLALIEAELRRDPFAFDLLWAAGIQHLQLGDREEAGEIFATFMIRAPRSPLTRQLTEEAQQAQRDGALPLP